VLDTPVISAIGGCFFLRALCTFDNPPSGMVDLLGKSVVGRTPRGSIPRWAEKYGYSERAVKKFIEMGKAASDPAPFDQPEQMEDWARRTLGKVTNRFRVGVMQAMGIEAAPAAEEKSAAVPMELPEVHERELGMEAQLDGYRREFAMLAKLREAALKNGEFSRASNYFDQQQKVSSEIRQLERLLPQVLESRGDYQRTAAVRSATVEFLTVLKRGLLNRATKAAMRLRASSSDAEMADAWRAEIHSVFRDCCAAGFAETLDLE